MIDLEEALDVSDDEDEAFVVESSSRVGSDILKIEHETSDGVESSPELQPTGPIQDDDIGSHKSGHIEVVRREFTEEVLTSFPVT